MPTVSRRAMSVGSSAWSASRHAGVADRFDASTCSAHDSGGCCQPISGKKTKAFDWPVVAAATVSGASNAPTARISAGDTRACAQMWCSAVAPHSSRASTSDARAMASSVTCSSWHTRSRLGVPLRCSQAGFTSILWTFAIIISWSSGQPCSLG